MRRFLATVPVLLLLAALLPALTGAAAEDPATAVQRFFEARNRYDVPGTLALVTDDFRFVGGPACTAANPCVGRDGLRANLQEFVANRAQATIVGAPQVSGTTVVVRIEVRSDLIRRAGVERVVNTVTLEVRGNQLASHVAVPDASDAQTAQFLAFLQSQQAATVVQRFFEARNRYDVEATLALVTDDFRFVGGPNCTPASPCLGREGLRAHLQTFTATRAQVTIVGAPQVSGTTVVVRYELRDELTRRAGVERMVATATIEVRGNQLASHVGVPDASDPQTAQYLAFLRSQQGTGAPPPGMPNTGGGGQAANAAGGVRTLLQALALAGLGLAGSLGGVTLRRRRAGR